MSSASDQSVAPTGSVTFYDGGTSLGTVPLSSGTATLAVSSLAPGNHSLSFDYSGDSNFAAIDDLASLDQTVSQDATTVDAHGFAGFDHLWPERDPHRDGERECAGVGHTDGHRVVLRRHNGNRHGHPRRRNGVDH